jgi:cyclopropane fatty-acyl-phospholipid synthase-like methyltransferase
MIKCALTGKTLQTPIYHSQSDKSITSLSEIYNGATVVYLNQDIGHLQTKEIENIETYYDKQYQFFNQSEEDDVLYKVVDGKKIFRQQHQVDTLLSKIKLESGMKILDYGCAKGTVMKRLYKDNPSVLPYLFDVSQMYRHLWEKFLPIEQFASYSLKDEWNGIFDLVTSFFAFEHTPDPIKELLRIKKLLKPNGFFYCIVPNVFDNTGDFIVADHVHHYSETSLRYMFAKVGLQTIEVDSTSHFAAFIIIGKNTDFDSIPYAAPEDGLATTNQKCLDMAYFWQNLQVKIRDFEKKSADQSSAIYGAGVYGNFIATCIQEFDRVKCFVDQNPLLHNTRVMGKPIYHPDLLPEDVTSIYVGINPKIASQVIANIASWDGRDLSILYL